MKTDTIAAIATAMSDSGIGIVRISGEDAFDIIDKIYVSKNKKKKLSEVPSHTIHYGYIVDGETVIDEVMVLCMRAPKTYTTEDTIEIDCHGGVLVTKRVLETVLKYGARPAEPGEYTKRAFLNGRIDLSQAESVIDVIHAKNDFALKSSMDQLQGSLKGKITELREKIIHEIAFIESALDDPEHYDLDGYGETLRDQVLYLRSELQILIDSFENGELLKEGIHTVIVGKPNVGKSSLMNSLVGKERAIVTDVAGTTRDVIEEQIQLHGITLNVIDTAGIHDTEDVVEKIGVDKAKSYVEKADLVIYVVDSSKELDEDDFEIMNYIKGKPLITLLNKSDLTMVTTVEKLRENISSCIIPVSVKEGVGMDALENAIKNMFFQGEVNYNDEITITNIRHKNAMLQANVSLGNVLNSIEAQMPEDFFSIDLMDAYEDLGYIIGESVEDDLVNEIFSKFCMGK